MSNSSSVTTKKTITWVTPDYFVDCDFNPDLFAGILRQYNIHWLVLLPKAKARFSKDDFSGLSNLKGLNIEFIYWGCRERSLKMLSFYETIYKRIKKINAEVVYFNYVPTNPFILPLYWRLNKNKTIVTAHDGNVKSSFKLVRMSKQVFKYAFRTAKYVNMFSATEAVNFKASFSPQKLFIIPLGLKDFGKSSLQKRTDNVVFLFFGSINSNKNLELLIDAACNLYEKGVRGFRVAVNGFCPDWEFSKSRIRYRELFECDIRMFKNAEIPDMFARSHYVVFPYKEISQSGALKVAFNYETPVIVSNLKSFTDEVRDNINGFVFKTNDVKDLERVMSERITLHISSYQKVVQKTIQFNKANYDTKILVEKYLGMFNQVTAFNSLNN